jgi:hypothetical protein
MQLTIDESQTIKNISSVFTDSTKVLSELMQNARRAGASAIHFTHTDNCLTIEDDGCGIVDYQSLFCLSKSGWTGSVVKNDKPFGMGFFSTIFACDTLIIKSNKQSLTVDCSKAKDLKPFDDPISSSSAPAKGTSITLKGFMLDADKIKDTLVSLAKVSRLPVFFNGVELSREYSLDELAKTHKVVETPFGNLVLRRDFSNHLRVYVQDLLVYQSSSYGDEKNLLFSDNLPVRMPDRDKLIEENAQVDAINEWLKSYFKNELCHIRNELNNDVDFLDAHFENVMEFFPEILNDIDYLPSAAFTHVSLQNKRDQDYILCEHGLSREAAKDALLLASVDECAFSHSFFTHAGALLLKRTLPSEHWVREFLINEPRTEDFSVSVTNPEYLRCEGQYYGSVDFIICDEYTVTHKPSNTVLHKPSDVFALYSESDWDNVIIEIDVEGESKVVEFIVTRDVKQIDEDDLLQINSYVGEFEDHLETDLELDTENLNAQVLAAVNKDPLAFLNAMSKSLPSHIINKVGDKPLIAKIGVDGRISFSLAA